MDFLMKLPIQTLFHILNNKDRDHYCTDALYENVASDYISLNDKLTSEQYGNRCTSKLLPVKDYSQPSKFTLGVQAESRMSNFREYLPLLFIRPADAL
ncbi:hypothetical protein T06_7445 [Trichinella sp. T6]|nr:hypothetical protein T06_7445 [Trichinella sp. T6]